jgi:predicted 3-demethylubiquinone-9 3-methyltransferase (glyoxalase superfamily)
LIAGRRTIPAFRQAKVKIPVQNCAIAQAASDALLEELPPGKKSQRTKRWRRSAMQMQKITPFLWFDGNAEEAMNFYTSIFKNSKIGTVMRTGDPGPGPKGSVLTASFELEGLKFTALNGGPQHKFTEAISFYVNCASQEEVDYLWDKLSAGGKIQQCGWLKDKFGLSWQIIPQAMIEMLTDPDTAKSNRVMQAMMQMKKIDLAGLRQAYEG